MNIFSTHRILLFTVFLIIFTFDASHISAQACTLKQHGDSNCDTKIDLIDYETWRKEFLNLSTSKNTDFNTDTKIDLVDYEVWRSKFISNNNSPITVSPTFPPSTVDANQYIVPGNNGGTTPASAAHEGPLGTGNFRIICDYSHLAYDDPIVNPGKPGTSHLHMFFGNTVVNGNSTYGSLLTNGDSTCHGRLANRSAYWAPSLLDGNGSAIVPEAVAVYYKSANKDPLKIQPIPAGLMMIAGFNMTKPGQGIDTHRWYCESVQNAEQKILGIPTNCGANEKIIANLFFPSCWNGRDLDSPDHRSHLSYPIRNAQDIVECPTNFPVPIPEVIYTFMYRNTGNTSSWYLSSDRHGGVNYSPGTSFHADWFGAWVPSLMNSWVETCIHGKLDCQNGQLGNDTSLVGGMNYSGPDVLNPPTMNMAMPGMEH